MVSECPKRLSDDVRPQDEILNTITDRLRILPVIPFPVHKEIMVTRLNMVFAGSRKNKCIAKNIDMPPVFQTAKER